MKIIERLKTFLGIKNVDLKEDGDLNLSDEDKQKLQEAFGDDFEKVMDQAKQELQAQKDNNEAEKQKAEAEKAKQDLQKLAQETGAKNAEGEDIKAQIAQMNQKIAELEKAPEKSTPEKVNPQNEAPKVPISGGRHTAKHLFGIESDFFSRGKPWNELAATRRPFDSKDWEKQKHNLMSEAESYGESLMQRWQELHNSNQLDSLSQDPQMIDYSSYDGTGWGDEYVVRRQDALIAYLRSLPSVRRIFPVRYGVQDKEVLSNAFLDDFSQAYQSGEVWKGGYQFEPAVAEMFDVMFKHQFTNMKQLEREYLGYLNREGSQPIKFNMIEWLLARTLEKLQNEWNERRILGYRIEPTDGVAGHHMFGSNGVITFLRSLDENNVVLPFESMNGYTQSTILDFVESLAESVNQIVPSLRGYNLYMNEKHIPWYKAAYREKYGTDIDFSGAPDAGVTGVVMNYSELRLVAVPNMGNSKMMWITQPGNIELLEDQPGEMANIYQERRLENLVVASWWKEGVTAYRTGKKFDTRANLESAKRKYQYIFTVDPYVELADGATTADGSSETKFVTQNNSASTELTDITNHDDGVVYRIECGGTTNATTITASGNFAGIDSDWTPTAVGDFIEVYYDTNNDQFAEVRRQVT